MTNQTKISHGVSNTETRNHMANKMPHKDYTTPHINRMSPTLHIKPAHTHAWGPGHGILPLKPSVLPFEPIESNIPKLEKYLLEQFATTAFKSTGTGMFPIMSGPKLKIHLKPHAIMVPSWLSLVGPPTTFYADNGGEF